MPLGSIPGHPDAYRSLLILVIGLIWGRSWLRFSNLGADFGVDLVDVGMPNNPRMPPGAKSLLFVACARSIGSP